MDDISHKSRSVSAESSSGESVVLHTPRDNSALPKLPHKDDYGHPHDDTPHLIDHCSRLKAPELAEVGYNLNHLAATSVPGVRPRGSDRRILTGSDYLRRPSHNNGRVIRFKRVTRNFWAEFFGTAILVLFGTAVNHQVTLGGSTLISSSPVGSYVSVSFGWALAVMLGVVLSGGLSGGHLNPAVTLALAIFRGFSWGKVPVYWLAQFLGATFGSALVYWNYSTAISIVEGGSQIRTISGTGGLFFTNPLPYVSNFNCFYNEMLMTAILMLFIVAVGDSGNFAPVPGLGPFVILWVVFGLASALGMQTSFALNPARDIGPRLLTWFAGYGNSVWSIRNYYWFTVATLGPVFGAIIGCLIYDLFLATEQVTDCLLHGQSTVFSCWPFHRPSAPVGDPEKHLTQYNKKKRAGAGVSRGSVVNSAKTSSHRYVSINS
ncbi:hypothetical protein CROQUDRAFT_652096 [Cronartium quercuum f. sp. fusiforme G11]|uniref:Aquaporin n=1 Tax=Cronartium quercuum f. sp. fusiforme G11 TaxID=708437 RepID=A0A9P6NV98_9BASI|nr:hypothetical protein CROQUDRAFT_652096 [Cronartium quercuum f. sp. fusiforme G11]